MITFIFFLYSGLNFLLFPFFIILFFEFIIEEKCVTWTWFFLIIFHAKWNSSLMKTMYTRICSSSIFFRAFFNIILFISTRTRNKLFLVTSFLNRIISRRILRLSLEKSKLKRLQRWRLIVVAIVRESVNSLKFWIRTNVLFGVIHSR